MSEVIKKIYAKARSSQSRIFLPEAEDARTIQAAGQVAQENLAQPVMFGPNSGTKQKCAELDVEIDLIEFRERPRGTDLDRYRSSYADLRNVPLNTAEEMLKDDMVLGGLLLRHGEIDGMVGGAVHSTAEVIRVANGIVGLAPGIETASSYFVMCFEDQSIGENGTLLYADCGVNILPTANQLTDIAITTAGTSKTLFDWAPRIAMLSFSTHQSAEHETVEKITQATRMTRDQLKDGIIAGEVQADAALVPQIAERKISGENPFRGNANILIFPNLDAGNIGYKLTEQLAGAKALGPILQGYASPVSDLSRGASIVDIVDIIAITAAQTGSEAEQKSRNNIVNRGLLKRQENELESASIE